MQTTDRTRSITDAQTENTADHAIVIGGSMAGLLAARVLADHFGQVTIIDRDRFPSEPAFRKGVPQSRHLHVLLDSGRSILERLFPGFGDDMTAAGAVHVDWPREVLWLTAAGWCHRFDRGLGLLGASRDLIEWTVRRKLATFDNVRFWQGRDVTGFLPSADRTAVVGCRVRSRGQMADSPATEEAHADLVVDASGRSSRTAQWLQELGYPAVEEVMISSFLGYASRLYAIPKDLAADWQVILLQAKPPANARGGVVFPIDGGRWLVTLAGAGRDYPPTDEAGFDDFARSLRSPILYEAIKDAEPLTPIFGYQRTENQLRRYEQLARWPERLLVIGDAACAFNPIYGQGMSVAAKAALELDRCLWEQRRQQPDGDLTGFARRFQRTVAKSNAGPWLMATGEDLRYPTTEGAKPNVPTRLMHRYFNRVIRTATVNAKVNRAFLDTINLIAPPTSLFRPGILLPALRTGGVAEAHISEPPPIESRARLAKGHVG